MKRVVSERFQESYVEETLDNGLKVVLWKKKDFEKSFFMMATPMGSLDMNQVDEQGNLISFPAGIAHFLEHKMFEEEDYDVMDKFAAMGASVNAFTSYNETVYYFSTNSNYCEPLNLLLDFVQKLSISLESVEKEKGIIIQELEMYQQMSEVRIINETLDALFLEHPMKYDIGGDRKSVNSTTKEQIEKCYRMNYDPSRMILIGVCAEDPEKVLEVIKENQERKYFEKVSSLKRKVYNEPYEVCKRNHSLSMNISKTKISYAFKCKGVKEASLRNRKEWCFKMIFDMVFSSLNPNYQIWLDKQIINHSFGFDIDFGEDYGLIMFYSESDMPEVFCDLINESIKAICDIEDEMFENLKRRYFGMAINQLNDHKQIAVSFMRNYFAGIDFFESMEVIETIKKEELFEVLKELDFNNTCCVRIDPII